jgi:dTDP-4-dehydrorhamnose 3,5-epimerase
MQRDVRRGGRRITSGRSHPEAGLDEPIPIDGVELIPLEPHEDARGSLTEIFRRSWVPGPEPFVQGNVSVSRAGVLRGLHLHRSQADYWCLLEGRAFIGLVDLRARSATEGVAAGVTTDAGERRVGLYIPPGVAHGFYAETDLTLLYLVDAEFTGADEFGLAWDDPDVAIAWPSRDPILSDRDRSNPSLREIKDRARL